jgi:hypothetical protein
MATKLDSAARKAPKAAKLGRSAATGKFVLAPVSSKNAIVSDQRIAAAVKTVLDKKK